MMKNRHSERTFVIGACVSGKATLSLHALLTSWHCRTESGAGDQPTEMPLCFRAALHWDLNSYGGESFEPRRVPSAATKLDIRQFCAWRGHTVNLLALSSE
jgi:hypothetical protein